MILQAATTTFENGWSGTTGASPLVSCFSSAFPFSLIFGTSHLRTSVRSLELQAPVGTMQPPRKVASLVITPQNVVPAVVPHPSLFGEHTKPRGAGLCVHPIRRTPTSFKPLIHKSSGYSMVPNLTLVSCYRTR